MSSWERDCEALIERNFCTISLLLTTFFASPILVYGDMYSICKVYMQECTFFHYRYPEGEGSNTTRAVQKAGTRLYWTSRTCTIELLTDYGSMSKPYGQ
jgi:hypothetical protein